MDIKTGAEEDAAMSFISLERKNGQEFFHDATQYFIPGIFMFLFGFFKKYQEGLLNSVKGVDKGLYLKGEKCTDDMLFQNITLKEE